MSQRTGEKRSLTETDPHPSIYVGESAWSVHKRAMEHWEDYRDKHEDSHILKHHVLHHGGEGQPVLQTNVVQYFRDSLGRQVAEDVRLQLELRGSVLNSKSVFNRCSLTWLTLESTSEKN